MLFLIPLLAMISSASACDLSCSLEQFHSICKLHVTDNSGRQLGSSSSSETAMDHDMDMSGGGSPTVQPEHENGTIHLHVNSCTHNPCNETSVSATNSALQHALATLQLVALEVPSVVSPNGLVIWASPDRQAPTLQPFDPLSVSLRL